MPDTSNRIQRFLVRYFASPLSRSFSRARKSATKAVESNVRLSEYLPHRLANYFESAPQEGPPLPSLISIDGTDIKVRPNPDFAKWPPRVDRGPDPIGEQTSWLRDQNAIEARALRKDVDDSNNEWNHFAVRRNDHRRRAEDDSSLLHAQVAEGSAAVPSTLRRNATERGRPTLPFPWRLIAIYLFLAVLITAEAYQFAIPFYDMVGVDFTNLRRELGHNPAGVLGGAVFAFVAVGVICVLVHTILKQVIPLYASLSVHAQRVAKMVWLSALAISMLVAAYGIAEMRHATSRGAQELQTGTAVSDPAGDRAPWLALLALTVLLPIGVACIHHETSDERAGRRHIRAAQRAWDQEDNGKREVRERTEELLNIDRNDEEYSVERGDHARSRIGSVGQSLATAKIDTQERIAAQLRFAHAFVNSVVASTERDKYLFIREARKRGLDALIDDRPLAPHTREGRIAVPQQGGNGTDPSLSFAEERSHA